MTLTEAIRKTVEPPKLTMLEIGALPISGSEEPFHPLIDTFPGSRIIAFEVDPELCERLNKESPEGIEYYANALGRTEETRTFYQTQDPMCASLYKPNEALLRQYVNLEVAYLKSEDTMDTVSLDYFVDKHEIGTVDFIKIDIQGAELEVFQGGQAALKNTLAIVTEVEFVPFYEDQPLFGDVCSFLWDQDLPFHKFIGVAGRTRRPFILKDNPDFPTQLLWADSLFLRSLDDLSQLSSEKLLKTAIFADLYESLDVALYCCVEYDRREKTKIIETYMNAPVKSDSEKS